MGAVWQAHDRATSEPVAVKVILNETEGQVVRFQREARLLAALQHPGIARHVDHGETEGGRHYLAMEWLDGEDLSARLARGPLGIDESLALVERVAKALGVVHARGIVHRDIKPPNLFLPGGDIEQVKILDFGIAREPDPVVLTAEGLIIGTPAYMAPEQEMGEQDLDARADVFSLGCVLYECMAGKPAFDGPHAMAVLAKIVVSNSVAAPLGQRARHPSQQWELRALKPPYAPIPPERAASDASRRNPGLKPSDSRAWRGTRRTLTDTHGAGQAGNSRALLGRSAQPNQGRTLGTPFMDVPPPHLYSYVIVRALGGSSSPARGADGRSRAHKLSAR